MFEPLILDDELEEVLRSVDNLIIDQNMTLVEDTILEKKITKTRRGQCEAFWFEQKGQPPSVAM